MFHVRDFLQRYALTLLALGGACKAMAPARAQAVELGVGAAAVEEGDDRLRPAVLVHAGFTPEIAARGYLYGRTYGPVKETTMLATVSRRWGLFKSNSLNASLGVALMDEQTKLAFSDPAEAVADKTENSYNAGLAFGISWSLPKGSGPLYFSASWDAALFPAGLEGMIFLSTGRKQTLSLIMGMTI